MDANDPEVCRVLEDSLYELERIRKRAKFARARLQKLYDRLDRLKQTGKIDEVEHQIECLKLAGSRDDITDTLRKLQRQRTLITSWIVTAEKK